MRKPLGIGICGLGFMGLTHWRAWSGIRGVRVAAVATRRPGAVRRGQLSVQGNIGPSAPKLDTRSIRIHARIEDLVRDPDVDVVDLTLPTPLHERAARLALAAGKPVICEKPLALTSRQADRIVSAFRSAQVPLFVAHCIRFWPAYVVARDVVQSGRYGRVLYAGFTRLAAAPSWSRGGWMNQARQSGAAAIDLHVHDTDYVQFVFGIPDAVSAQAAGPRPGQLDQIVTAYHYRRHPARLIVAESGWLSAAGFPFTMRFRIEFEAATLTFGWEPKPGELLLHTRAGRTRSLRLPPGDGYSRELAHFAACIRGGHPSPLAPPGCAVEALRTMEAELRSARRLGQPIRV